MSDTSSLALFHLSEMAVGAAPTWSSNVPPLTEELEGLVSMQEAVRPAAFLVRKEGLRAAPGSTRAWGAPDVPVDAPWAARARFWDQSPYDGECLCIQLNLEDIPATVRRPEWPAVGVLWVTLPLNETWQVRTYFDPRPAASIVWQPREKTAGFEWVVADTWAPAIGAAYPALVGNDYLLDAMEEWVLEHQLYWPEAQRISRSALQVGGWVWPCQGDAEARNADFVCGLFKQAFGDSGEVSVHYTPEKGFFGFADTH